jgi:hypothetical protein
VCAGSMGPSNWPDASGICWWISSGSCSLWSSIQPTFLTGREADQGYTGAFIQWAAQHYGMTLDVVDPGFRQLKRYAPDLVPALGYEPGFRVVPKRWIVEIVQSHITKAELFWPLVSRFPGT